MIEEWWRSWAWRAGAGMKTGRIGVMGLEFGGLAGLEGNEVKEF